MKCLESAVVVLFLTSWLQVEAYRGGKKTKCFSIPTLPMKVKQVIKSCQDEVKTNLIEDLLFAAFNENPFEPSKHQHLLKEFEDHLFHHHDSFHSTHSGPIDHHSFHSDHHDHHNGPISHHNDHHEHHNGAISHDHHHHSGISHHNDHTHHSGIKILDTSHHHQPDHHHHIDSHHHIDPHQHQFTDSHHLIGPHVDPKHHTGSHHFDAHHHPIDHHPIDHHPVAHHLANPHYPVSFPHHQSSIQNVLHNLRITPQSHSLAHPRIQIKNHHQIPPLVAAPHHHDSLPRLNPNPPVEHHLNPHPHSATDHQPDHHLHKIGLSQPIVPVEVSHHHEPGTTYHAADVTEAHEALTEVLKIKRADPHDNHHHISAILTKLRSDPEDTSNLKWHRRSRRSLFGKWTSVEKEEDFIPTVISHEDRWLAGCLMQCVYRKNDAVDKFGLPTLEGLTNLYTNGNNEQGFFIHVLKSVDKCLKAASAKHSIVKGKAPIKGETCDVAFDVFDCVSDSITEYCS